VRLGDIVVGTALLGYRHVHRVDGVEVIRRPTTGISVALQNAANELRIRELDQVKPWLDWLDGKDQRLAAVARPPARKDVLYVAGRAVKHPSRQASHHTAGRPKVHYGVIGSADVLLRDEAHRDELVRQHKVIAFEMEGTGIAAGAVQQGVHWFVVRGIV